MIAKTIEFFRHLVGHKNLFYELVKRDILEQYRSSYLGVFWAIFEPIVFMLLLAFVFDVGLRAGSMMEVPFVAYMLTGMSIYFLFSGVLEQSATVIKHNAYLLNKVNFRVSLLPLVKICSETVTHFFTLFPVLLILLFLKISPSWYWFQALYYLAALIFFLLGSVWLVSALSIFIPDIGSIIRIITRFLLYLSPLFWDINMFPSLVQTCLKLNPMYYIVSGYRDSFLFQKGFWCHPLLTVYFWVFSLVMFVIGVAVFRYLRPHFADFV